MTYDEQEPGGQPAPGKPASGSEPASEASGDDKVKARAVSAVLDDPRSIEEGPLVKADREMRGARTRRVLLGYNLMLTQIEEFQRQGKTIEIDPDRQVYEIVELPHDHAAGRPQRGTSRLEEKDKPKPVPPVDHAGEIPQAGTPADPDPLTIHGFRMSTIAAVAFGAVQSYKARVLKQSIRIWEHLTVEERAQIAEQVRPLLSGGDFSPTAMHETWARNMRAAGVTVERNPQVGMAWGDLDPGERRKGFIFAQVCIALTRAV